MPPDEIGKAFDQAETVTPEPPRPLVRDLPLPDPFPVEALGPLLGAAAQGIHDRTQAPLAICGSSVLAAAALAAQAHADMELPTGQRKPLSLFLVSVAASGERKSTVDGHALWPVRQREAALREQHDADLPAYANAQAAWEQARKRILADKKRDKAAIRSALDELGPAPAAPLFPLLTCEEPTLEGLVKLLTAGQASVGIFSAEGGLFMGGHAMSEDARLRSAAGLSILWDGQPLSRVRASEGVTILLGRRVSLHLMAQPDVASGFLTDPMLADQGLIGRVLATAPETTAGSRFYREASPRSDAAVRQYGARLLDLLERPLPLAEGKSNELAPRALPLSEGARQTWIEFSDHIEALIGPGGELETVRALANKAAEHAGRMAGVLALVANPDAGEIEVEHVEGGVALMEHFLTEALRLTAAGRAHPDLKLAQQLLAWLHERWQEPFVSLPDVYQRGPNAIRDQATAARIAGILEDHGWLLPIRGGARVAGTRRRTAWTVVR